MNFYLIQRGIIKTDKRSEIRGLDSLVRYDYMGASEFEWGALPRALTALLANLDKLQIVACDAIRHPKTNARLFLISTKEAVNDILPFLHEQAAGLSKAHLHEPMGLRDVMVGAKWRGDINFWWDIENHWMATFGKENAENVLHALKLVVEKRKLEPLRTYEEQIADLKVR